MIEDNIREKEQTFIESPWRNVYWFARMLINSDKYGAVGKNSRILAIISSELREILNDKKTSDINKIEKSKYTIRKILTTRYEKAKSKKERIKLLCDDVDKRLIAIEDLTSFILTAESIMIPINEALSDIPSDDLEYTLSTARTYLDKLGNKGLATVINFWDDAGVEGCLAAERAVVVREFASLREKISKMPIESTDIILTAFVQEFERRLGQKRKARAGGSLEDVASFIFEYYGIEAAEAPEHFQADIEVDKWFRCKDKWLIGISCKRTLRERWKNVSSADRGILSKFKIRQIWHLITYDEDLSDDKITLLGGLGHIFYLRDDSRILKRALDHVGMKNYVRPISHFVKDVKKEQAK